MSARSERDHTCEMLAAAMDALDLPVLVHDDERILFANAAAVRTLGGSAGADFAGLTLDAFVVPELAPVIRERRGYLLSHRVEFRELPIKMQALDGTELRLVVNARPIVLKDRTVGLVTLSERGVAEGKG